MTGRRAAWWAAAGWVLLAGCGQQGGQQAGALADGTVTRAEYEAAYASFAACVTDGGGRIFVQSRDPSTGIITYGTGHRLGTPGRPSLGSVEGRCYHERFDRIDYRYGTEPDGGRASG